VLALGVFSRLAGARRSARGPAFAGTDARPPGPRGVGSSLRCGAAPA